ncbi:MAG: ROK family protein [Lewinellaceae bacterium]|nr:ROK family protein [Saprospiraceae bacterium]MCB9338681.1 ROK family protein [Lewinellaceae bacterium]
MEILGIDVGGSGIKAAIVNIEKGKPVSERHRIATPKPAKPAPMATVVHELVEHFNWKGPVGCGFPAVIVDGKATTSGNIDKEWVGVQVDQLFGEVCGLPFKVGNDADVAGLAEMKFGTGKGKKGMVILVTIGTGLGTGVFYNGQLVPNIELGRIFHTDGRPIEYFAADSARKKENLSLEDWAKRFDFFLNHVNRIFSPNYFIIGGGQSKKLDDFKKYLTVPVPIEVAKFKNMAGIVGAAMYAAL